MSNLADVIVVGTRGCDGDFTTPSTLTRFGSQLSRPTGPLHWAGTGTATRWAGTSTARSTPGNALLAKSSRSAPHERRPTDRADAAYPPISSRFPRTSYDQLL